MLKKMLAFFLTSEILQDSEFENSKLDSLDVEAIPSRLILVGIGRNSRCGFWRSRESLEWRSLCLARPIHHLSLLAPFTRGLP